MNSPAAPRYGTPNLELLRRWLELPATEDGPFWAVNLMKYRPLADYADGRETSLTGMEADDLYAPHRPIEAVGGMVAFGAEISEQLSGDPEYDRIAIVRYPSRAAFFEMQRRDDFQELHVHKDAGMEFTTVIACLPETARAPGGDSAASLLMRVRRLAEGAEPPEDPEELECLAHFRCEGTIIGDGRHWDEVLFDLVPQVGIDEELASASDGVEDQVIMMLKPPVIDLLVGSVDSTLPAP